MERPDGVAPAAPRALIVAHHFPPHIGGLEEVARAQAGSLAAKRHEVTVLTTRPRRTPRRQQADGYQVRRVGSLHVLESWFGIPYPIVAPTLVWFLARHIRRARIVHLHDVFYLPTQLAFLVAAVCRRPYFLTQHVALVDHPSRFVMAVQRVVYRTIGRAMLRRAERVVVYNARVRDFVIERGVRPERVVMTHNGIDTDFFTPATAEEKAELRARYGLPVEEPVVLFAGRLVPKKGADIVVAAADRGFTTVIVGEGAGVRLPVKPGVIAFGAATREQMRDLYRLADVFAFPAAGEMFTLVMQEAMAAGLPIVTTDDPAYAEYDVDRSLVAFVDRTPVAVRAAILRILTRAERREAMSRYSRRLAVERFSWRANYHNEYGIYVSVRGRRWHVQGLVGHP